MNKKILTATLLVVFIVIAIFLFFRAEEPVKEEKQNYSIGANLTKFISLNGVSVIDFAIREPLLNKTPKEPRATRVFNDVNGIKEATEVEWVDENGYTMVSYYVLEFRNENFVENLTNKIFPKFTSDLSEIVFSRRLNILDQSIDEYKFSSGFLKDYRMKIWSENRFAFVVFDTPKYDKESIKVAKWIVQKTEELKLGVKK